MRFFEVFLQKILPEWAQCYYDYKTCKSLISVIKKARLIKKKIADKQDQFANHPLGYSSSSLVLQGQNLADNQNQNLRQLVIQANILFFRYHNLNKQVVFLFSQLKIHELSSRLILYEGWLQRVQKTEVVYLQLVSNTYYQSIMLEKKCKMNLQAYKKILYKHNKVFNEFNVDTPPQSHWRIIRTIEQLKPFIDKILTIYQEQRKLLPKKARDELQQYIGTNPTYVSVSSYLFGVTNGISVSLFVVAIIILSITNTSLQTNQFFKRDFPVWRAVSYVIMYMWIFSLGIVIYEKYKINYQLVLGFSNMSPTSTFLLTYSSAFTFIFMTLFIVYVLNISDLITIDNTVASCFPVIVWGFLIGYMIIPLPILNYQGRLFFFKMLFFMLISPIYQNGFHIIWMTQQFISYIEPVEDIFYSICYYARYDFDSTEDKSCEFLLGVGQIYGIVIFVYRLLQCLNISYKRGQFLWTVEFYIAIRSILNIILLVVSFLVNFIVWAIIIWYVIFFPILLFSYFVDLKADWGLLNNEDGRHPFLRNKLGYNAKFYYVLLFLNFILRSAWLLTLSPTIVYNWFPNTTAYYIIYLAGFLEIVRRLFWNLLKMQNQHMKNVEKFRITTSYEDKQKVVRAEVDEDIEHQQTKEQKLEKQRKNEQLLNLRRRIDTKMELRKQIKDWIQIHEAILEKKQQQIDRNA